MKNNYIEKQIKKSTLFKIRDYFILALIIVAFGYGMVLSANIKNLKGPERTITSQADLEIGRYVNFKTDSVFTSGYSSFEDEKIVGEYGVVELNDGTLVIVLFNGKHSNIVGKDNQTITGIISPFTLEEENLTTAVINEWINYFEEENIEYDKEYIMTNFAYVKINYNQYNYLFAMIGGWLSIGFVVMLLIIIFKNIFILINYKQSKIVKEMGADNFEHLEYKINQAFQNSNCIFLNKRSIISDAGVAIFYKGEMIIDKIENLAYVYKEITNNYDNYYGIKVSRGQTYALCFQFDKIKPFMVKVKNEIEANRLVELISQKYPNKIYGNINEKEHNRLNKGESIILRYPKTYRFLGIAFIVASIIWIVAVLVTFNMSTSMSVVGMLVMLFFPLLILPVGIIMLLEYNNWKIILINEHEFKYINTFKKEHVIKYSDISSWKLRGQYLKIIAHIKIKIDRLQIIGIEQLIDKLNELKNRMPK